MTTIEKETRRWLTYAHTDLSVAEALLRQPDSYPRHACFWAQQAAEKTIKAALVFLDIRVPRSRDLNNLRDLLPAGWRVKDAYPDLTDLSSWAVEPRYPGDAPEAVEADAREAIKLARGIWDSVTADLAQRGFSLA